MKCFTLTYSKFTQISFFPLMKIIYFLPPQYHKSLAFSLFPFSPYTPNLSRAAKSSQKFYFSYGAVSSQTEKWQEDTKTELKGALCCETCECPGKTHHSHTLCVSSCVLEFSCPREKQKRQDH